MDHDPVARRDVTADGRIGGFEKGLGVSGVLVRLVVFRVVEQVDADDLHVGSVEAGVGVALFHGDRAGGD